MKDIREDNVKVILKPDSPKNKIIKFDSERNAYIVEIKAPARNNKANLELVKFLSRFFKKDVKLIKGFKNREKTLKISPKS